MLVRLNKKKENILLDEERHRLTLEIYRLQREIERLSRALEDYGRLVNTLRNTNNQQTKLINTLRYKLNKTHHEIGGEG